MVVFHGLTLVLAVLFKFAVTESSKEEDPRIVHGQVGISLSFPNFSVKCLAHPKVETP